MKENKRRSLLLIIITISVFLIAVLGATYAFFATTRDVNNVINANIGTAASMYSFSASSNGNIEMNILFNEMSEAGVSTNVLKTDNATINVSLASPTNDMKTVCTYDIVWVWDSSGDNIYTSPDMTLPSTIDNKTYNYEFSAKVDSNEEKDLSKYPISGNKVTLQKDVSIESSSTTATTKTHRIDAYIYNIPVDQEKLFDKSFKAHITIDNLSCNMESGGSSSSGTSLASYLVDSVYKTEQGNTDPNGTAGLYYHDGQGTYTNANLEIGDNSYRYSGADPKNYVCFSEDVDEETGKCADDNLYRIIGVIDNRVKVIKYTDINKDNTLAWNSTNINTWEGSTLETYLNGTYLNSLTFKDKIAETSWYVDGMPYESIRASNTVKDTYEAEIRGTPINKKIGLMYVSDYGYAALPRYWNTALYYYDSSNGNDWMFGGTQWTISRVSNNSSEVFYVDSTGAYVGSYGYVDVFSGVNYDYNDVFPSFSLPSSATITNLNVDGVGSKDTPMIIGSSATETLLAKYWNDDFGGNYYAFSSEQKTPSTTYRSVAELQEGYNNFSESPVYIKTIDKEHQACLYYNNKEFCLSKGYFETDVETTEGKLQNEMAAAFGIEEGSLSCDSASYYAANCRVGDFGCSAYSGGNVSCSSAGSYCDVVDDDNAICY